MTGLHTGHTPVRGNKEIQPVGAAPDPGGDADGGGGDEASGLCDGGVREMGAGVAGERGGAGGAGVRQVFTAYNCQRNAHTYYPTWLYDNEKRVELDGETYAHDLIMDEALAWVEERGKSG